MPLSVEALTNEVLSLPRESRLALAEKLLESLADESGGPLSPAWSAEIKQRIERYRRGEMRTISAENVFRSLSEGKEP